MPRSATSHLAHRPSHTHPSAFTLVELLVVIGIIAVLISMLLPALSRARKQARVVECSSLLRQIALATRAYAAENRDALPPFALDVGQPTFNIADKAGATTTILTLRAFSATGWGYNGSDPAGQPTGANIGRLNVLGFLKGDLAKVGVCPEAASQPEIGGWGTYDYNPHLCIRTNGGTGSYQQPWWKKASKFGVLKGPYKVAQVISPYATLDNFSYPDKKWALVTDAFIYPSTGPTVGYFAHQINGRYFFNMAMIDGSVATAISNKNRGNGVNYGQMYDTLTYLERVAAGTGNSQFPNNPASAIPIDP